MSVNNKAKTTKDIGITLSRNYGNVSYGVNITVNDAMPQNTKEIYAMCEVLRNIAIAEILDFEQKSIRDLLGSNEIVQDIDASMEWFTASRLVRNVRNGKLEFNIQTVEEAFAKFGVAVYDEIRHKYGLYDLLGEEFIFEFPDDTRILVDKTGKHKKVVRIVCDELGLS